MRIDVDLSGRDCRGRNGWFRGRNLMVWGPTSEGVIVMDVSSVRMGKSFPITIYLTQDEARELSLVLEGAAEWKRGD